MPENNESPAAQALRAAVLAAMEEVRATVEPQLAALGQDPSSEMSGVVYAQNVLRVCMETVLRQLTPHTVQTNVELAGRLASYAISAAPPELQEGMARQLGQQLPAVHARRVASGAVILTEWDWVEDEAKSLH